MVFTTDYVWVIEFQCRLAVFSISNIDFYATVQRISRGEGWESTGYYIVVSA